MPPSSSAAQGYPTGLHQAHQVLSPELAAFTTDPAMNQNLVVAASGSFASLGSRKRKVDSHDDLSLAAAAAAAAAAAQQQQQQQQIHQLQQQHAAVQAHQHPSQHSVAVVHHAQQHHHHHHHQQHQHQQHQQHPDNIVIEQPQHALMPAQKRKTRTKWTDAETNDLLRGCTIHGVGNWKKILQDAQFTFNNRSAVDLKDRFRTYFPDEYRRLYPNATTHGGRRQRAPLPTALPKVNRKERRSFTPSEDQRLLQGFLKHGPSWSKIQKDEEFRLFDRRSTDLRDRFRNAFPDRYEQAGFKTRAKSSSSSSRQMRTAPVMQPDPVGSIDLELLAGNATWADDQNSELFPNSDLVDASGAGPGANVFYDPSHLVVRDDSKIPIDPKVTEASSRRK
ncbi:uncharacterized protein V1516DRAFT_674170 [Lipomyces oligophaga]|uniref:uncharacterized protein n=1 Tax=Lipomyces oligophaga TaxID=45792 RepID=UPI0034CF3453